jgi:hypothetical protein
VRCVAGTPFKTGVVTCDGMNIVVIGADKGSRDAMFVFHARTGSLLNKVPLKQSASKVPSCYSSDKYQPAFLKCTKQETQSSAVNYLTR